MFIVPSSPKISAMPKLRTTTASKRTPYTREKPTTSTSATMPRSNSRQQPTPTQSTLTTLHEEAANNITTPIYFWKPNEPFGFLGQWYKNPTPMFDPSTNLHFVCTEQYMMYHKARTFNDDASADAVMATDDPRTHKAIGRKVSGFTDHEWDRVKRGIVVDANMLKFTQGLASEDDDFVDPPPPLMNGRPNPKKNGEVGEVSLKELLLATGDREIVEASPRDRVWGVGFGAKKAEELRGTLGGRERWGNNYLGKALMEVRESIREQEGGSKL